MAVYIWHGRGTLGWRRSNACGRVKCVRWPDGRGKCGGAELDGAEWAWASLGMAWVAWTRLGKQHGLGRLGSGSGPGFEGGAVQLALRRSLCVCRWLCVSLTLCKWLCVR